jgi:hypothetical protein
VEPTYKPFSTSHNTLELTLLHESEDKSVSRVLCVRVPAPTEGLGGAPLVVSGVLQIVLEPTLVVVCMGQCVSIGCTTYGLEMGHTT